MLTLCRLLLAACLLGLGIARAESDCSSERAVNSAVARALAMQRATSISSKLTMLRIASDEHATKVTQALNASLELDLATAIPLLVQLEDAISGSNGGDRPIDSWVRLAIKRGDWDASLPETLRSRLGVEADQLGTAILKASRAGFSVP
jgi:hypothetical protein